ncbi:MAG: tetratricopeptide repeat protein, partial [Myxococcales bacterium]|nr:tetratricopeptide repeat protein [Myxococcales bacterium]
YEAITHGNLGVLEHEAGRLDEAERHHRTAIELLAEVGDPRSEALARARLGAVLAARGATAEAIQELDEAERRVVGRDAMALAVVRLHRCFVDLAQGEEAAAERRLALAQAPGEDGGPSLAAISDDARLLLRLVGRQSQAASGPSLRAAADGSWFEPPGGERQSLERYKAARLILARLIEARHAQPGEGLSGEALFEAGWPGTRIAAESANNRLYVALAKLRKLGLKLFLLRDDAGYFLDPNTTLELASD